mmetsp:Transcript_8886/g.11681  ORF Transcript_8886/g.11681 Transcript_8886/m.11681 type:complete len:1190 (-) Transcript_8886:314-3883(-)
MGINGFLVLVSGLLLLLEVASRENAADVGQIFSDGGLPRKNTDTLKLVPEDIYTDRALAGALHNESWYASGYGESCTTGCQAVGLICDENELYAHNSEVDSTSELLSMIESLGYSTSATYCWSYSDSYYNYVPGWTSYSCSVASSSLSLSTYDCESIYYSGYRLCYCVEEETSSPTLSMATSNTAGYTGSCILTLNQFDSYGDGWNGYYFGLYEYGSSTALQSITLSSGSSSSVCLSYASSGSCYTFQVSSTGSFSSEISWNLCGTSGDTSTSLDFCIDSSGACTVGAETSSPTLSMTYSDTAGYTGHCITSPGWYCSAVTGNVEECSIGYYCPDYNMTAQLDCPAGYYCNETGLTAATECGEGYYCESTGMTVPTECPIAYYCPEFTAIDATECPSGYYCGETGLYAATQCGVGYYCSSTMMTAPTECPISYYCPESTATTGTICPQGYYCDETGLSAPTECGAGYYCNSTGMAAPTLCPEGHYCGTVTTVSPTECGYGYYCNGTGLAEPTICPAGTMCNETTLATPFACPEFDGDMKVFCKQGSSDIGICPEGSYCSDAATIAECPIGSYCPRGSESPIACETENYEVCPYENMTEPMYCATENQNGVLCYETGITECSAEVTPAGLTYSCTCWGLFVGDTCYEEQSLTSSMAIGFSAFFLTIFLMFICLHCDCIILLVKKADEPFSQNFQKKLENQAQKYQVTAKDTATREPSFVSDVNEQGGGAGSEIKDAYKQFLMKWSKVLLTYVILAFMSYWANIAQMMANVFLITKGFYAGLNLDFHSKIAQVTEAFSVAMIPQFSWVADVFYALFKMFEAFDIKVLALNGLQVTCEGSQAPAELLANLLVILLVVYVYEGKLYTIMRISFHSLLAKMFQSSSTKTDKIKQMIFEAAFNLFEGLFKYLIQLLASILTVSKFLPSHKYSATCGDEDAALAYLSTIFGWFMAFQATHVMLRTFIWGLPRLNSEIDPSFVAPNDPSITLGNHHDMNEDLSSLHGLMMKRLVKAHSFRPLMGYFYALGWKIKQLLKLTAGYWDEDLIKNFKVAKRADDLALDADDEAVATLGIIQMIGQSNSLIWQFNPLFVFIAKFGEYSNFMPVYIAKTSETQEMLESCGFPLFDKRKTGFEYYHSLFRGRYWKWMKSMFLYALLLCISFNPEPFWITTYCALTLPLTLWDTAVLLEEYHLFD